MQLSAKQAEFWNAPFHRWCVKSGATRSGKTWLDYYLIPKRIRACAGREGLILLMGNTKGTLQRNIIEPMQALYGAELVSSIRSDNTARLFGAHVHCLGADTKKHVDRLRGASIQYCYGDEVATWSEDVFAMLKSRLDRPYSRFDGTCNPAHPGHWFKRFLDSDADIFQQTYALDDNPHLDPAVRAALKREYAGTVDFDRYVLGRWVAAEGAIYRQFADAPERFIAPEPQGDDRIRYVWVGIDFGGNGSAHAFSVLGTDAGFHRLWLLDEYYRREVISPAQLEADFVDFMRGMPSRWRVMGVYADSAEQVLIRGLNAACVDHRLPVEVANARKGRINDRIRFFCRMMSADRFRVTPRCAHTIEALRTAVWDDRHPGKDVRLDDGSRNVDSLDAMEYAVERAMGEFLT